VHKARKVTLMSEDFHRLLASLDCTVLHAEPKDASAKSTLSKAAILPFVQEKDKMLFAVMQPKPAKPQLGAPKWQLCKGTRMILGKSQWRDMRPGEEAAIASGATTAEALGATALREGREELGLIASKALKLYDMGVAQFTSASTQKPKKLWLFALQMPDCETSWLPIRQVAPTTAARQWCSFEQFKAEGRTDHLPIVENALTQLHNHFMKNAE